RLPRRRPTARAGPAAPPAPRPDMAGSDARPPVGQGAESAGVAPIDVLGIEVAGELTARWRGWLMPTRQPYLVATRIADRLGLQPGPTRLSMEIRDSFWLYGSPADQRLAWLTRAESRRLPREVRRAQPAAHRWPTTDVAADVARTIRHVASGRRRSRHRELTPAAWRRVARVLPYARDLAGTFPERSGPNCFGAVMGAAGVPGAADSWMQRESFEEWLAASTVPGGTDAD